MLTITSQALSNIRRVTAHPALDTTSGLRIAPATRPDGPPQVRAPTPRRTRTACSSATVAGSSWPRA